MSVRRRLSGEYSPDNLLREVIVRRDDMFVSTRRRDGQYAAQVNSSTRGQDESLKFAWLAERQCRITSSNFGSIVNATDRRDMDELVDSLPNPVARQTRPSVMDKKYKPVVLEKYVTFTGEKGSAVWPV